LSVYRVKAEMLKALQPDVILTQIQCAVCAVSERDVKEATCEWTGLTPEIVSLSPDSLEDVWEDIRRVAKALGPEEKGEELIERLRARMRRLSERAHSRPSQPRVAVIEWIEPLMAAGNWIPTLIEMAGGKNLFGEAGKHSPYLMWETLRESDPDVIIISPLGV
jgi:iron complex transport system substrate-binding protein